MRRGWRAQLFIVTYLLVQLALPLRALLRSNLYSSGGYHEEFSWNMYARESSYTFIYQRENHKGRSRPVASFGAFERTQRYRVVHRDRLPVYHAWLCERLRERGRWGPVTAEVRLAPRFGPEQQLVQSGVDICTADNFGVVDD